MIFFPDFAANSREEWRLSLLQSILREQIRKINCRKFWNQYSVKIIQYCSILFIRFLALQVLKAYTERALSGMLARWESLKEKKVPRAHAGCIRNSIWKSLTLWEKLVSFDAIPPSPKDEIWRNCGENYRTTVQTEVLKIRWDLECYTDNLAELETCCNMRLES